MASGLGGGEKDGDRLCAIRASVALLWPEMSLDDPSYAEVSAVSGAWVLANPLDPGLSLMGGEGAPLRMRCLEASAVGGSFIFAPLSEARRAIAALKGLKESGWSVSASPLGGAEGLPRLVSETGGLGIQLDIQAPQSLERSREEDKGVESALKEWESHAVKSGARPFHRMSMGCVFEELFADFAAEPKRPEMDAWRALLASRERRLLSEESGMAQPKSKRAPGI